MSVRQEDQEPSHLDNAEDQGPAQSAPPVRLTPRWAVGVLANHSRLDAVVLEDRLDRIAGDVVPEVRPRAADTPVAPRRVLVREANHERGEVRLGARATRAALLRAVVLPGDQQAIPTQNRLGRHDAGDVGEAPSAEGLAFHGQTASLVIAEANPAGTVRRTEDPVLLAEVINDGLLLSIDPA